MFVVNVGERDFSVQNDQYFYLTHCLQYWIKILFFCTLHFRVLFNSLLRIRIKELAMEHWCCEECSFTDSGVFLLLINCMNSSRQVAAVWLHPHYYLEDTDTLMRCGMSQAWGCKIRNAVFPLQDYTLAVVVVCCDSVLCYTTYKQPAFFFP